MKSPHRSSVIRDAFIPLIGRTEPETVRAPESAIRLDTALGSLWLHDNDQEMIAAIRAHGVWKPEMSEFLGHALAPGMCVLAIGAHIGYHTIVAARAVAPHGVVIALEPDPANFALLCSNLGASGVTNVIPIRVATTDSPRHTHMSFSQASRDDHRTPPSGSGGPAWDVACVRIDDLVQPDLRIDVVTVDSQGADHRAIRGMERIIARHGPLLLVTFWPTGIRAVGDDPRNVLHSYRDRNCHIRLVETPEVTDALPDDVIVNAVEKLSGGSGTLVLRPALPSPEPDAHAQRTGEIDPKPNVTLKGWRAEIERRLQYLQSTMTQQVEELRKELSAAATLRTEAGQATWRGEVEAELAGMVRDMGETNAWRGEVEAELAGMVRDMGETNAWRGEVEAELAGMVRDMGETNAWRDKMEQTVAAVEQEAHAHADAIRDRVHSLGMGLARLDAQLYAVPYMANPRLLRTTDTIGRPAIGFRDPAPQGISLYRGFEDIFRGTESLIRERQRVYLPLLTDLQPVVDIGCGRGEFLDLLAEESIPAVGVDLDPGMVAYSRTKGHVIYEENGLAYLAAQPDRSIGVIFAAQVIEHMAYEDLLTFFVRAKEKLAPGGLLIAETVNPHALDAFKSFWVDLTHRSPIHPEVAAALCWLTGYAEATVLFPNGMGDLEDDRRTIGEYAIIGRTRRGE